MSANFFLIVRSDGDSSRVLKLLLNANVQNELEREFERQLGNFETQETKYINFSGGYRPDDKEKEMFRVNGFRLPDCILKTATQPQAYSPFTIANRDGGTIQSIFMVRQGKTGSEFVFQSFQQSKIIDNRTFTIFYDKSTFRRFNDFAISIGKHLAASFHSNALHFLSYFTVRQFLDLTDIFSEATEQDITDILNSPLIACENEETVLANCDTGVRRKFSLVKQSGILEKTPIKKVKDAAKRLNVDVKFKGEKIDFPMDKKNMRGVLKFLCEEVYEGPLTGEVYETNSKRRTEE